MSSIVFGDLRFELLEDKTVVMAQGMGTTPSEKAESIKNTTGLIEIQCAGDNHSGFGGSHKRFGTLENKAQKYVSHKIEGDKLTIITRSNRFEVENVFTAYEGTNAIKNYQNIKNITDNELILETANTSLLIGFGGTIEDLNDMYFHEFISCHHYESQPKVSSFRDLYLFRPSATFRRVNIGSKATDTYFPQGIIENRKNSRFMMFQIESDNDWYYELGPADNEEFYLYAGGPDAVYHSWCKKLAPGAVYTTVPFVAVYGTSLNEVLKEMTLYRRTLLPYSEPDKDLPVIFNEYMHLAWNAPYESVTRPLVPVVADLGAQYYVIDCGWHDDVDTDTIYNYTGEWYESRERYPGGIADMADYVHSHGLKFGLWVEPEVVGQWCTKMLEYYDDDCFLRRNGEKICEMGRYFLDMRHPKVRAYLTEVIDRMCNEYKADYIKFDYNEECGPGTELYSDSLADGLQAHCEARAEWVKEITARHPNVIFENCASGGQRLDYKTMSMHTMCSTSDQVHYYLYPYVATNLLTSVLPEQAAVWSYPVNSNIYRAVGEEGADALVTEELVVINMINSLLGRIHLASRVNLLAENKKQLIRDGIAYYHHMTPYKKNCVPYLPCGYAQVGDGTVAAGIKTEDKLFLAVWNLKGDKDVTIPLPEVKVKAAKVGYPVNMTTDFSYTENEITVHFTEEEQARLFEIDLAGL